MSTMQRGLKIPVAVVGHKANSIDPKGALLLLETTDGAAFEVPVGEAQLAFFIEHRELELELWGKVR